MVSQLKKVLMLAPSRGLPVLREDHKARLALLRKDCDRTLAALQAYTDGSYVNKKPSSGIGCVAGPDHPLNFGQRLLDVEHKSTLIEIVAVQATLLKIVEWEGFIGQPISIWTDLEEIIFAAWFS